MTDRVLARVAQIQKLIEIPGANNIELAIIDGWQVVVGKGSHKPNDFVVYFEIDSLLPLSEPAFVDLGKRVFSKLLFTIDGEHYVRIKTAKMMKQLSQGYVASLQELRIDPQQIHLGQDLTEFLGILKYESSEERSLNNAGSLACGTKRGLPFPSFIPKTDQNRIQNIQFRYDEAVLYGEMFEKTYKLDGSSLTAWMKDGVVGVASRNVSFRMQPENRGIKAIANDVHKCIRKHGFLGFLKNFKLRTQIEADVNAFTQMAKNSGVFSALAKLNRNIAFQGEMVSPSIQKNFEGVDSNQLYIYDVYDIDAKRYLLPQERLDLLNAFSLKGVPSEGFVILPETVADAIEDADGPSGLNGKYREGFVYKSLTRDFSFKVISNKYLLKEA